MSSRSVLVLRHILDSLLVVIIAAAVSTLLVRAFCPTSIIDSAAGVRSDWAWLIAVAAFVMLFVFAAAIAPRHLLSAIAGLRRFPMHLGLVVRCWAGGCLCVAMLWLTGFPELAHTGVLALVLYIGVYTGLFAVGLLVAGLVAFSLVGGRDSPRETRLASRTQAAPRDEPEFRAWLTDDRAICDANKCLVPAHLDTAKRLLEHFVMQPGDEEAPSCNVALIGPYGSGKTSICNLVQSEYIQGRRERPDWPALLFCRFEAWRYLTPEAALTGLIEAAVGRVLEEADESALWSLGDQYVLVAREAGLGWARAVGVFLGGERNPGALLERLGHLLVRINKRLVVFVDDLDRIEATSADQQQAVVQALNQFQAAANVQYVLTAGPARWAAAQATRRQPLLDLLKLTRFQELVPEIAPDVAIDLLKLLRERARAGPSLIFPWDEGQRDTDPLSIHLWDRWFVPRGYYRFSTILTELLRTPRELKTALRETYTSWEQGLKGEINWYHLLLANALKVAEPAVFEWILRDKEAFLTQRISLGRDDQEANRKQAEGLQERCRSILQVDSDDRYAAVAEALKLLFPVFGKKIDPQSYTSAEPQPSSQDIASTPANGQPYLVRFSAGQVPTGDLPDSPALQYIKRVREAGFDARAFEGAYLGTPDNLTKPLNKVVQFARLLGADNILAACDAILEWASQAESIRVWPDPGTFYGAICGDVYRMLSSSPISDLDGWLRRHVPEVARSSPLLADTLIRMLDSRGSAVRTSVIGIELADELWRLLGENAAAEFVMGDQPLGPVVTSYPFALYHFLGVLQQHHTDYDGVKERLTRKLIREGEQGGNAILQREVLLALTHSAEHPIMDGVPAEAYKFTYDTDANDRRFDMPTLMPVLRKWHAEGVEDPLSRRVLTELAAHYGFGTAV